MLRENGDAGRRREIEKVHVRGATCANTTASDYMHAVRLVNSGIGGRY
jgi:hypothetical protein